MAKDKAQFTQAFNDTVAGGNACHTASSAANWYIANPPPAATAATTATVSAPTDLAGVDKLVNDKFNKVDRSLALWNTQPGLGTVMIEYGNRYGRLYDAAKAGNWDMAKYQLDEMIEIQEVGETTRPTRSPMAKAFEDSFLKPVDDAIMAQDKTKAAAAVKHAAGGCNACHVASKSANWASYGYVDIQAPQSDPADYLKWQTLGGTGNYIATPASQGTPGAGTAAPTSAAGAATAPAQATAGAGATSAATPAGSIAGGPPPLPADHAGRTMCLACHATGQGGAPKMPVANPDHSAFKDDNCAVHRCRNPQAVPVDHRRLGQPVREFDLQRDALLRFQNRTRHLTVESLAAHFAAGRNLPIDFTRLEAVPDDTPTFRRRSGIAAHEFFGDEFLLLVSRADGRTSTAEAHAALGRPTPQ